MTKNNDNAMDVSATTLRSCGLEWQAEPAPNRMTWGDAMAYAAALDLGGGGWRLPTRAELIAFYDSGVAFGGDGFWSSTVYANLPCYAWNVGVGGDCGANGHDIALLVRCVR